MAKSPAKKSVKKAARKPAPASVSPSAYVLPDLPAEIEAAFTMPDGSTFTLDAYAAEDEFVRLYRLHGVGPTDLLTIASHRPLWEGIAQWVGQATGAAISPPQAYYLHGEVLRVIEGRRGN